MMLKNLVHPTRCMFKMATPQQLMRCCSGNNVTDAKNAASEQPMDKADPQGKETAQERLMCCSKTKAKDADSPMTCLSKQPPPSNLQDATQGKEQLTCCSSTKVMDADSPMICLRTELPPSKLRDILNPEQDTNSAWEQCWIEEVTPWDLKGPTPIITHLVKQGELPDGKVLVPGCGSGYDVIALASPSRHVVGMDISKTAIQRANELKLEATYQDHVEFLVADFFSYSPPSSFDLIYDYTFFCALDPSLRSTWGQKMSELLADDGELITIIFPLGTYEGGPPYAVSFEVYEEVLRPWGLNSVLCEPNKLSVQPRKGSELLARWKKIRTRI